MAELTEDRPTILIVGDWVVDEYWFLVRHHSAISSHTGFVHYRVSSDSAEIVADLCGAGHIARALYQLRAESGRSYNLVGVGKWNDEDTDFIAHLVHARNEPDCGAARANFKFTPTCCSKKDPEISLLSLAPRSATIRVVRLYHEGGQGLEQLSRVDWEPPRTAEPTGAVAGPITDLDLPSQEAVHTIVINDLNKGAVTAKLIEDLKESYPKARWYVRTKNQEASWLDILKESLALRVLGPEIAALLRPWQKWLPDGRLTLQAHETLAPLPGQNVVLLSDQHEVIARLNDGCLCVVGQAAKYPTVISELGWPTAFFAAMVGIMHDRRDPLTRGEIQEALDQADRLAGVPAPRRFRVAERSRRHDICESNWANEAAKWRDARTKLGIVKNDRDEETLEVWRGCGQLPDYIACIREKRRLIEKIGRRLRAFVRTASPAHSLNILLQADPGAGKTFLAESLAQEFDFEIISYNITQMIHREELLDLFETVATAQTRKGRKPLVFVDEINALLENELVYGAFLAPLEEGRYVRRGKKFSLKPCVWMFAGTRLDDQQGGRPEKLSDFKARMTLIERLDYESLKSAAFDEGGKNAGNRFEEEARLEQVYLGAAMIRREFSDVQEISREILEYFYKLDPANLPARRIRMLARSLRDIQYGRVTRKNCDDWGKIGWGDEADAEKMVKVVFSPGKVP